MLFFETVEMLIVHEHKTANIWNKALNELKSKCPGACPVEKIVYNIKEKTC